MMKHDRILGIFISLTVFIWILVFALSPQPKYRQMTNISIPELPMPVVDRDSLETIEFEEVKNSFFKADTEDTLPSAKDRISEIDFNFYVYKIGAFGNTTKISKLVKSFNDQGFPAFTEQNQSNKNLTNLFVGPFASKRDIEANKQKLNNIAEINAGEVIAWNP
tara:strand:+ start:380 stop:871 length:492 start_codon:yes stop_codon:yes gene_type:complete